MARKVQLLTAGLAILAATSVASAQNADGHNWAFAEADWSACTPPEELTNTTCEFSTRTAYCIDAEGNKAEDQTLCDVALKPADETKACAEEKACKNNGICVPETYTCECPPEFIGDLCDTAVPTYVWNATTYGDCKDQVEGQTCGAQIAERTVVCVDEADIQVAVKDELCDAEAKPDASSSEPCVEPVGTCAVTGTCSPTTFTCECQNGYTGATCADESEYHWVAGPYGECGQQTETQTCGAQIQTRTYHCAAKADAENTEVDAEFCTTTKPADETSSEECEAVAECVANQGTCNTTTLTCDCANKFAGDLCADEADFFWTTTEGACGKQNETQICGEQVKTISPICVAKGDEAQTPVDDEECNAAVKPDVVVTSEGCEAEEVLCTNGGVCGEDFLCACTEGFTGDLCADTTSHKWVYGDFGACEKQVEAQVCGQQLKTRAAFCAVNDETLAPAEESNCATTKPPTETTAIGCEELDVQCENAGNCNTTTFECECFSGFSGDLCETADYYYKTGAFSECVDLDPKMTCNVTQVKLREVSCAATAGDAPVDDERCVEIGLVKPATQEDCDTVGKCEKNGASSSSALLIATIVGLAASLAIAF